MHLSAKPHALRDPAWHGRLTAAVIFVVLLGPAFYLTEFNPATLWGEASLRATRRFMETFVPPAHSLEFLALVAQATWKTVAIATVGTTLAMLIAFPLALAATRTLSVSQLATGRMAPVAAIIRTAVRWVLIGLRSVPEIVWAMLFVRAVGLGDTAGVVAIGITYGGMLGKIYIEILESGDTRPAQALLENGAGRLQAFWYGVWPVSLPELTSYTIYRWECAIRASVVMGFVGAGGLGQQMELSMKMLAGGEVLTMLLVFVGLVWIADQVSAMLRKALA
ncbi:MAG: phosphate/phosphonate ABC transporter permease [Betaproteobacteria bacterium]|nr:phosphate/phosphonate ABC transporter permease [Betaproteobacteria bacterium]